MLVRAIAFSRLTHEVSSDIVDRWDSTNYGSEFYICKLAKTQTNKIIIIIILYSKHTNGITQMVSEKADHKVIPI